jgi:hypothetical protein
LLATTITLEEAITRFSGGLRTAHYHPHAIRSDRDLAKVLWSHSFKTDNNKMATIYWSQLLDHFKKADEEKRKKLWKPLKNTSGNQLKNTRGKELDVGYHLKLPGSVSSKRN